MMRQCVPHFLEKHDCSDSDSFKNKDCLLDTQDISISDNGFQPDDHRDHEYEAIIIVMLISTVNFRLRKYQIDLSTNPPNAPRCIYISFSASCFHSWLQMGCVCVFFLSLSVHYGQVATICDDTCNLCVHLIDMFTNCNGPNASSGSSSNNDKPIIIRIAIQYM